MKNLNKIIDFYEFTMAYVNYKQNTNIEKEYFDIFFRKNPDNAAFSICAGLEDMVYFIQNLTFNQEDIDYLRSLNTFDEGFLDYLKNFKFKGDVYAIPEGTPVFPMEPCVTVIGNPIEVKLLETQLLLYFNHQSLITTKANRIVRAADGRAVMEFGARRAQGEDAAIGGARCAYMAGCAGTSCYETGKQSGVPLMGTMAHCGVQETDDEYQAFLNYAKTFPNNCVFLIDTIDTLHSGVVNAIRVAYDYLIPNGYRLKGVRLDSGDLAYLSKQTRKILDEAGLNDCKICLSNSLDEYTIADLINQGAPIDSFGVGERMITAKSDPVFGGVYKLAAIEKNGTLIPKVKISENVSKTTTPGYKKPYRFYDKNTGYALGDVIALATESISKERYTLVSEHYPWKKKTIENYEVRSLQVPVIQNGELVYQLPTMNELREYCNSQMKTLYPELLRFQNPALYYVDLSDELCSLKYGMIEEAKQKVKTLGNGLK